MPLKKEYKKIEEKNEEEYHQIWIDFKPIYNTLESQTIFVRGLCSKTPPAGAACSTPQILLLNLTHFACVRLDRLASTDPQIFFLHNHLG